MWHCTELKDREKGRERQRGVIHDETNQIENWAKLHKLQHQTEKPFSSLSLILLLLLSSFFFKFFVFFWLMGEGGGGVSYVK